MRFEGPELLGPERLDLVEPRLQGDKRLRPESVHAQASVLVDELGLDEPALAQHAQVPAHRWTAHPDARRQLARSLRPGAEEVDDGAASRIRERGQSDVHRGKIVRHWQNG